MNLSDSCWMQQHCVPSGCGQITKITFYCYPGGNSPLPFLRQTTLINSLQQFSCTHLGRKTPRRHLEDHLPLKRNQHCWLSFCMTHAWLCPVSSDLSHIGVDNDKNNTDPQFCSLFSYLDDNNKDCKCQRGKVRQSSLNHRSLL